MNLRRTLGPLVIAWIEANLVHGPGDVEGQRIVLDDEQVAFLLRAYEIDDQGRRVVRRAVFSRPKGRAKSELGAEIGCAEALGPVRFAGWDDDGYPLGRPVRSPFIRCAATEEGQAGNVYDALVYMLREGPVAATPGLDVGMTRTILPDGGVIAPITAKASSKDGGKETFAIFDETHLFVSPELHRLHDVIRRNLAKRRTAEPWSLEVSTMYEPNEGSVAEYSHQYAQKITSGAVKDAGFLFDHRSSEPVGTFDFDDDDALRKALVQAYGAAAEWMDIERLVAEARDPQTQRSDFIRYFLNLPTSSEIDRWITPEMWARLADPEAMEDVPARVCFGADGAITNDCTATAYAWPLGDGRIAVRARVWSARRDVPAHEYSPQRIDNRCVIPFVQEVSSESMVEEFAYDPRYLDTVAQMLSDEGFVVVDAWSAGHARAQAWQAFRDAVDAGTIVHDGDSVLAAHVTNATAKQTDLGWKVSKLTQRQKIDALVAAAMAHWRAQMVLTGQLVGFEAW